MEQNSSKGAVATLTLQRLLDTHQATAVLPKVLYFATMGECLAGSPSTTSATTTGAATTFNSWVSKPKLASTPDAGEPTAPTADALRDFFLKENPSVETQSKGKGSGAALGSFEIPATSAAIGSDAIFLEPCGIPPYVYRPFFADFGPLDLGCCVHFARRLRDLLHAVGHVDLAFPPGAVRQGNGKSPVARHERSPLATDLEASNRSSANISQPAPSDACSVSSSSSSTSGAPTAPPVVICVSLNAQDRVNVACLLGAFCILVLGWSTAATWSRVFAEIYPGFPTYRDASAGVSNYPLTLQDVWSGLEQAVQLGWVGVDNFDLASYWEGKEADFSWIVPRRFLAMSSPRDAEPNRTAELFAPRLRAMHVRLVIRLNDNLYSPAPLRRLGIQHFDLPYADGSTPNDSTLLQFLQVVEDHFGESITPPSSRQWWTVSAANEAAGSGAQPKTKRGKPPLSTPPAGAAATVASRSGNRRSFPAEKCAKSGPQYAACSLLHSGKYRGMPDTRTAVPQPMAISGSRTSSFSPATGEPGAVAVHCLAGLGRTGTMIAVYVMRHYGFTARGVIGWMRLCRPGSIAGVQQQYLDTIERRLRPSPYVLATQILKDFVQTLRLASKATTLVRPHSSPPASAIARSGTDSPCIEASEERSLDVAGSPPAALRIGNQTESPRGLSRVEPVLRTEQPWQAPASSGIAAFQTHGNVVGDARPLAGVGSGLVQNPDKGQWGEGAWSSRGLPGMQLRVSPQQPPQLQSRRRSSSNSLSFSADHPNNTALDAISSMPVLGDIANEQLRNMGIGHLPPTSVAAASFHSELINETFNNSSLNSATVRALPRVGDYKYASTYFMALERANRRLPPRSKVSNSNSASGGPPARPPHPPRGKSAAISSSRYGSTVKTRAATASTTFARCSSRLDIIRQQQSSPQLNHTNIGSSGSPDLLSLEQSLGRKPPFSLQRRTSLTSSTAYSSGCAGGTGDANGKWGGDDAETPLGQHQSYTATARNPLSVETSDRGHSTHTSRLRKVPQKPDRAVQSVKRHLSLRSSSSQTSFSWKDEEKGDDEACPTPSPTEAVGKLTQGPTLFHLSPAKPSVDSQLREMTDGAVKSLSPRSSMIPEAALPLWGRSVGCV
ncbi:putative tyrosine phosphatase [Leptomonas seymouri]|uniref:Putative tyrosine phosphatase n=1 Tax=Leptomonas seymouri TaxID=5684 RepID=A0A0N1I4R5_LEPSE|nr:putative tyrosine phosphatase [Leptomonas seymouri]|eukprot:KPI86402.1 putative tyrosine phosphatase [Leptomonas seymouri]